MGFFFPLVECFLVVEVNEKSLYNVADDICTKWFSLIDLGIGG